MDLPKAPSDAPKTWATIWTRLSSREPARHVEAIICRTVIDYENAQELDLLLQNAVDAVSKKTAVVKTWTKDLDTTHMSSKAI
jgi:hypothetical protein